MSDIGAEQLKRAAEQHKRVIESQHGGVATHIQSVRVVDTTAKPGLWDGIVYVFELKDHPTATRAYAWSSIIQGSNQTADNRFFAVLHQGQISGPVQAVRAAAGLIQKGAGR